MNLLNADDMLYFLELIRKPHMKWTYYEEERVRSFVKVINQALAERASKEPL